MKTLEQKKQEVCDLMDEIYKFGKGQVVAKFFSVQQKGGIIRPMIEIEWSRKDVEEIK